MDGWPHDPSKLAVTTLVLPGLVHEEFPATDPCACGCDRSTTPMTIHVCATLLGNYQPAANSKKKVLV